MGVDTGLERGSSRNLSPAQFEILTFPGAHDCKLHGQAAPLLSGPGVWKGEGSGRHGEWDVKVRFRAHSPFPLAGTKRVGDGEPFASVIANSKLFFKV